MRENAGVWGSITVVLPICIIVGACSSNVAPIGLVDVGPSRDGSPSRHDSMPAHFDATPAIDAAQADGDVARDATRADSTLADGGAPADAGATPDAGARDDASATPDAETTLDAEVRDAADAIDAAAMLDAEGRDAVDAFSDSGAPDANAVDAGECPPGEHRSGDGLRCTADACDPNPCAGATATACIEGRCECIDGWVRDRASATCVPLGCEAHDTECVVVQVDALGGTFTSSSGFEVRVPPGAVATSTTFRAKIVEPMVQTVRGRPIVFDDATIAMVAFEPDGVVFAQPIDVFLPTAVLEWPAEGAPEDFLPVSWTGDDFALDDEARTSSVAAGGIVFSVPHFSSWAIVDAARAIWGTVVSSAPFVLQLCDDAAVLESVSAVPALGSPDREMVCDAVWDLNARLWLASRIAAFFQLGTNDYFLFDRWINGNGSALVDWDVQAEGFEMQASVAQSLFAELMSTDETSRPDGPIIPRCCPRSPRAVGLPAISEDWCSDTVRAEHAGPFVVDGVVEEDSFADRLDFQMIHAFSLAYPEQEYSCTSDVLQPTRTLEIPRRYHVMDCTDFNVCPAGTGGAFKACPPGSTPSDVPSHCAIRIPFAGEDFYLKDDWIAWLNECSFGTSGHDFGIKTAALDEGFWEIGVDGTRSLDEATGECVCGTDPNGVQLEPAEPSAPLDGACACPTGLVLIDGVCERATCEEYLATQPAFAGACNANTARGYYWVVGEELKEYGYWGLVSSGVAPPCDANNVGAQHMTAAWQASTAWNQVMTNWCRRDGPSGWLVCPDTTSEGQVYGCTAPHCGVYRATCAKVPN